MRKRYLFILGLFLASEAATKKVYSYGLVLCESNQEANLLTTEEPATRKVLPQDKSEKDSNLSNKNIQEYLSKRQKYNILLPATTLALFFVLLKCTVDLIKLRKEYNKNEYLKERRIELNKDLCHLFRIALGKDFLDTLPKYRTLYSIEVEFNDVVNQYRRHLNAKADAELKRITIHNFGKGLITYTVRLETTDKWKTLSNVKIQTNDLTNTLRMAQAQPLSKVKIYSDDLTNALLLEAYIYEEDNPCEAAKLCFNLALSCGEDETNYSKRILAEQNANKRSEDLLTSKFAKKFVEEYSSLVKEYSDPKKFMSIPKIEILMSSVIELDKKEYQDINLTLNEVLMKYTDLLGIEKISFPNEEMVLVKAQATSMQRIKVIEIPKNLYNILMVIKNATFKKLKAAKKYLNMLEKEDQKEILRAALYLA